MPDSYRAVLLQVDLDGHFAAFLVDYKTDAGHATGARATRAVPLT